MRAGPGVCKVDAGDDEDDCVRMTKRSLMTAVESVSCKNFVLMLPSSLKVQSGAPLDTGAVSSADAAFVDEA